MSWWTRFVTAATAAAIGRTAYSIRRLVSGVPAGHRLVMTVERKAKCLDCRRRDRYKNVKYCETCAVQNWGYRKCNLCLTMFLLPSNSDATRCSDCRKVKPRPRGRGARSIWIVGQAGSPGLGRGA